jgi:hypothetical protein
MVQLVLRMLVVYVYVLVLVMIIVITQRVEEVWQYRLVQPVL